jgi:uncharacterized protein YgbK (DUF1537 family)
MIDVLIIADSLTSSAESGVKFAASGPVKLVNLSDRDWSIFNGILTVDTNTLNQDPQNIPSILAKIKPLLGQSQPNLILKNVDSCLGGFIGLETASLLDSLDLDFALVAPASPENGHITLKGIQMVGHKPIHTTDYGNFCQKPLFDSRLKNIISQDHNLRVESLEIDLIRKGPPAVEEKLKYFLSKGGKFLVACDSEFFFDLEMLVKGSKAFSSRMLFSGSVGLAGVIAELSNCPKHNWLDDEFHPPSPIDPIIFFGGSYSSCLREQFEKMTDDHYGEIVDLRVEALFGERHPTLPLPSIRHPLILTLSPADSHPSLRVKYPLNEINNKFGQLAADLIKNRQYSTFFIAGGDLAGDTLKALGLNEIWIRSEFFPGVPFCSAGPLSLLTKADNYGPPEILSELYQQLLNEDNWPKNR